MKWITGPVLYRFLPLFSLLAFTQGCKEKFVPELKNQVTTGYLVVEGFINSGTGPTTITLSRTTKLVDTNILLKEIKASVRVESKRSGTSFLLTETSPGVYTYPQLALDPTDEYHLRITTLNSKQYVSDYSTVRTTVDIDSVSWRRENGGLQIYANAHDASNKTRYYRYQYDETWEFHSSFGSYLKAYDLDAGGRFDPRTPHVGYRDSSKPGLADSSMYRCWKTLSSFNIILTSTEKLTQDVVSLYPLIFIEPHSWKLGVLYSINVKQYASSQDAYRFYDQLRKNTQQLGSIFDAQPSDNNGNIHPLNNSGEPVIGFIEVTQERQKRIYISNAQVPGWAYDPGCFEENTINVGDSVKERIGMSMIPTTEFPTPQGKLARINYAPADCVDCRLKGISTKPPFWP